MDENLFPDERFAVVCAGNRATCSSPEEARVAARTLRQDARDGGSRKTPEVIFLYDEKHVITLSPTRSV
jgi:hypothetical protein